MSNVQQSIALSLLRPITPKVLENRERTLSLLVDRREHKLESDNCSSHSQPIRQESSKRGHVGASGSPRELRGKNSFFPAAPPHCSRIVHTYDRSAS